VLNPEKYVSRNAFARFRKPHGRGQETEKPRTPGTGNREHPVRKPRTPGTGNRERPVRKPRTPGTGNREHPVRKPRTPGTGQEAENTQHKTGSRERPARETENTRSGKPRTPGLGQSSENARSSDLIAYRSSRCSIYTRIFARYFPPLYG